MNECFLKSTTLAIENPGIEVTEDEAVESEDTEIPANN